MDQIKLAAAKAYATSKLKDDQTGHGLDHINRVVKMSQRLANGEGIDPFLPMIAAYLHDTIDEKLVTNVTQAQAELSTYLIEHSFSSKQVNEIMNVITNISFAHTLDGQKIELSIIGKIVRDADWLDAIGAIGITRAIYYGGGHQEKIYDPAIKPRHNMSRKEYRNLTNETIINHFDEKLLHLTNMMQTKTAQKIAAHRQKVMENYLTEFHAEWDAKL